MKVNKLWRSIERKKWENQVKNLVENTKYAIFKLLQQHIL